MPVIDLTDPLTILLCLAAIICSIFIGHETKRAFIPAVALIFCVALLIVHAFQLFVFGENYILFREALSASLIYDFGLILLRYLSYLWIDDVESKARNKKSIDNSLDWFWSKI